MAFYDSRVTRHHDIARDIMHNHASGSNYHSVSNGHAGTYGHIASQPAVLTYRDRIGSLLCLTAKNMVLGMLRSIKLAVGTQKGVTAYGDIGTVENCAAEVQKDALRKMDSVSMVAVKRRGDIGGSRHARDKLLDHCTIVLVIWGHCLQTGT